MSNEGILCNWFGFCDKRLSDDELIKLDAELIQARRALISRPPEDQNIESYYDALENKIDDISSKLKSNGFAGKKFDVTSPVYRQSLWKYWELFGRFISDKKITNEEANTLFDIASNSEDLSIIDSFKRLVNEQVIYYRWGGFGDQIMQDRDVSLFANTDAGGLVFNLSSVPQNVYMSEPNFYSVGYAANETILEKPFGIKWESESLRKDLANKSKDFIVSEYAFDINNILSENPEKYLYTKSSEKTAFIIKRFNIIKQNINNIPLTEQEMNYLFSMVVHPSAARGLAGMFLIAVADAKTLDVATKNLYVTLIEKAYHKYIKQTLEFFNNLSEHMIPDPAFPVRSILNPETQKRLALALRQDVVSISNLIINESYMATINMCDEEKPLLQCEQHKAWTYILTSQILTGMVPKGIVNKYGDKQSDIEKMIDEWSNEKNTTDLSDTSLDYALVQHFMNSESMCDIECMHQSEIKNLINDMKNKTTPIHARADKFSDGIFQGALFAAMFSEGYFAPAIESEVGNLARYFKQPIRWLLVTGILYSFVQPISVGIGAINDNSEDVLQSMISKDSKFRSYYEEGECKCVFYGDKD